jgi:hypothetical protein
MHSADALDSTRIADAISPAQSATASPREVAISVQTVNAQKYFLEKSKAKLANAIRQHLSLKNGRAL